jgi:hypothetical protein
VASALVAVMVGCASARVEEPRGLDPALREFVRRAGVYATLHRRIEADGAPLEPTEDPRELAARRDRLAQRIHKARADAKPGDVFT